MRSLFHHLTFLVAFSLLLLSTVAKAQSFVWAQAINATGSLYGIGIGAGSTDTAGNLYNVGVFGGIIDFGGVSLTAVGNQDMFVVKKDPSGNLIWAKQIKGLSSGVYGCGASASDVDSAGNIIVAGIFRDSFDFDPGPAVHKLNSFGMPYAFVLKLDSAGNFIWVRAIGASASSPYISAGISAAKLDKNGNFYFAGTVSSNGSTPLDVDPGSGVYNITPGNGDMLLEKLGRVDRNYFRFMIAAARQTRL